MAEKRKKVLITDPVSEEGIEILRKEAQVDINCGLKPEEIIAIIGDYEALMVRSQTKVTAAIIEAGKKLQVIARAGVGIDNVDVEAATRCGVVVVNAPTGNTVSAAEHTIALLLASARNIPQANALLKSGVWKRNEFMGTELRGKTLGIIGLGNVGSEVAKRAQGFEMKLLGIDPLVSVEYAKKLQVELVELKQLLKESERRKMDRKELVCQYCGKKMIRHIIQEGARFHVTSWHGSENGALEHCSEHDCENNHGLGHCVPMKQSEAGDKFIWENFR
jgi:D-3-phosphoglycerate dehydrogenase